MCTDELHARSFNMFRFYLKLIKESRGMAKEFKRSKFIFERSGKLLKKYFSCN